MSVMRCSTAGLRAGDEVEIIADHGAGMLAVVDVEGQEHIIMEGDLADG